MFGGIDGFTVEPGADAIEKDNHHLKLSLIWFEIRTEVAEERRSSGYDGGAGTSQEVLLVVVFVARRTVAGRVAPFGFLGLSWKDLMNKLEEEFVDMAWVADCSTKEGEIDGLECWVVPFVNSLTLVKEVLARCCLANVMFVVAGNSIATDVQLCLGGWE
jgi:hypothetical protein